MLKPKTWLLAGAVLTLCAGAAIAAGPAEAEREASSDAQAAAQPSDGVERKERREVRIYRSDGHREHVHVGPGGHAEHLKDILQLRPEQEPALKAFLDATAADRGHRDHMVKFDRDDPRTTVQRLDEMQARLAEQQAAANRKIAAIRTFYGQLDAQQKKAFDAMPMLMMVAPSMGPMMIPHPVRVAHHHMPTPPEPPAPPEPPKL